jgi:murein DD-endopeptidase MepM/ murein hydrolase activator NlpD
VKRLAVLSCALFLAAGVPGSGLTQGAAGGSATAHAWGVRVNVPGLGGGGTQAISAPPQSVAFIAPYSFGPNPSILSTGSGTANASADLGTRADAGSSVQLSGISMFGGELTVANVSVRAQATGKNSVATGDVAGSSVSGIAVLGQAVSAARGTVSLGDWGYVVILSQGASTTASSYRGFVKALEVHVTADHNGVPAGTTIEIGYADVAVEAPPPGAATTTTTATEKPPFTTVGGPTGPKGTKKPPEPKINGIPLPPLGKSPPPGYHPKLKGGPYVFPVYGPSAFSDTFHAFRADVGWHHGDDIFSPLGAPILAVADGTVYSVGWNDIGGYRLWLRDRQGNQYYYAHLSAYSPLAVNRAPVHAGDVLGFVGNTGDAQGTPYHLHFEIHPVGLLGYGYDGVVDPTSYLMAWKHLEGVRFGAAAGWAPTPYAKSAAPPAGAILLQVSDISSASGLEPGSLQRALTPARNDGDFVFIGGGPPKNAPPEGGSAP